MASIALARVYQRSFASHPYGTLAFTNGVFNALGDAVAQVTEIVNHQGGGQQQYDPLRTLRFFAFGFGMGPLIGRWNFVLERHFPLRFHGGNSAKVSVPALAKRVAADQIMMAPLGLAIFIGSMGIMEGRDAKHISQKYSDLLMPLLITNWQVWPIAQLINFRFMPLPYRVPFQSGCGVFWTLYLSLLNSKWVYHSHASFYH
ncbi:hypothetical protein BKA93DRAFT_733528 [Sparassis latifolia]